MRAQVKNAVLLGLLLAGATLPASAATLPLDFSGSPSPSVFDPSIGSPVARLADGSYAVVWQDPSRRARLQWVSPKGEEILSPGGRPFSTPTNGEFPVVAANPRGGAFVAFVAQRERGWRIQVQSFDADATPRWEGDAVAVLESLAVEYQKTPWLLAGSDGGVFVCFGRSRSLLAPEREADQTVCQRLDAEGHPVWPGGRVAGSRPGRHFTPSLVTDGGGGLLVFWTAARVLSAGSQPLVSLAVEGQHLSADGQTLWEPRGKILHYTPWYGQSPQLSRALAASDGRGGAILSLAAWRGRSFDVLAQRVSHGGVLLWGQGVSVGAGPAGQAPAALAAAPDGGAAVVVQKALANGQSELVLARVDPGGRLLRPAPGTVLSAPSRYQAEFGAQASFDGGRLRILWSSHPLGNALQVEIRSAVFDRDGRRLTPRDAPPLVPWGDAEARYFAGFAFDPARNQGLAVWTDWQAVPPGDPDLSARGALFDGAASPP